MSLHDIIPGKRRRLDALYRSLFSSPDGRVVLQDLLRNVGVLSVAHAPGDPCETAFQDGRRSVGLELMQRLRWTEGELVQLSQERTSSQLEIMEDD